MAKTKARSFRDLDVYQRAFSVAMRIHEMSAAFPATERYSLTDQIRRSSRSVCANIAEAWRKRRYPKSFVSKLADAEAEASEAQVWLEFARACGYLSADDFEELDEEYDHLAAQLNIMISQAPSWSRTNLQTVSTTRHSTPDAPRPTAHDESGDCE